MSQRHVEQVIGRLATDEHWRARYRQAPQDALDALITEDDLTLSLTERRALLGTPSAAFDALADSLDPRLQRMETRS